MKSLKSRIRVPLSFAGRFSPLLVAIFVMGQLAVGASQAFAQTPLALPNTITSIAGGAASSPAAGTACAPGSPYTSTDSIGDGCPASLVALGADNRGGVAVDNFGNVFVMDMSNNALRMIDPRSGLITLVAGKGTACSAKTDTAGDGCLAATQTVLNNPRGLGVDPYGNVFIAGYSSNMVNVVCRAVSPLCSASQIGNMYRIAGAVTSSGSGGAAVAGATAGSAGDGTPAVSSVTTTGVDGPRGVGADQYGNVYIGDTTNSRYRVVVGPASFNGVANPLPNLIAMNPAYSAVTAASAAGNIYPIAGGFTAPAAGAFCNGTSGAKALDALGNGCPYYYSSVDSGNTGDAQGIVIDSAGDIIFPDVVNAQVRVIYMGGAQMANMIVANNSGNANWLGTAASLNIGSVYLLAGKGSTTISATPTLGSKTAIGNIFKITLDALGNIYLGDSSGSRVDFIDVNTGYIRALIASGTNCAATTDAYGDGCPASQSTFSGSNGLGVAVDNLGNLYLDDASGLRIRKVSAASLIPTAVGNSFTQTIKVHVPPVGASTAATGLTASFAGASPEIVAGAVSCGAANADFSLDCSIPVTFSPVAPGTRSATLTVSATGGTGSSANLIVSGVAQGEALVVDSSATASTMLGSALKPQSVALDGAGNVYTMDLNASRFTQIAAVGGAVSQLAGTLPSLASQIAVDTQGNVYAVGASSSTITKLTLTGPATWTAGTVSYTPPVTPAQPQAIAVDSNGTIYIYNQANAAIYKIVQSSSLQPLTTLASGFNNVVALTLDPNGNLYAADKGAQQVYKITQNGVKAAVSTTSTITPVGVATDAAGNLLIQDAVSGSVIQVSLTGPSGSNQTTVLSGLVTPNGIAMDGNGNVYSADAVNAGIVQVQRSQVAFNFGTSISTTLNATLTSAGNTVATGYAQSDASDFQVSAGASNGCVLSATSINPGFACTIGAAFAPSGSGTGPVSDALTLAPAPSSVGALTLTGTKTGTAVTTVTAISGETPASPIFAATGSEVSFTVTVTPSSGSVDGTVVQVAVDGGSATSYTLSGGAATVALSGLSAGGHTITATYPTQSGIVGSSSGATSFSIGQLGTAVTWTPITTTLQVSQPIGTGVLNASSGGVTGQFAYTATPSGGSPMTVDASTYLTIGTYSLSVTFTPNDGVDYATSTGSLGSLIVTKANTVAAVGATQNLVAADGSGNFTSVQAAVNALSPTAGGTIYVAPGTYNGFVTVNTPYVSLRGLGGNPANVIVTNEDGAFSAPFLPGQGVGNGGSSGDQGSATMVVAKGTVGATTYIPNAFYMENLTVANTYDTDTTNSNTNALVGGACTGGQAANNNQALFNAGTLCNSQALALWITADQAVLNNVQLTSLQDTLYAGGKGCGAPCVSARQYFWKGRINGDVDYIFGDAAAVFDHTVFNTLYHGATATGTETIEAQNKKAQTGSPSDYLSGYVLNNAYLLSQSSGMTNLYYGRPYGQYSTYIMLNSFVDQVNPTGWIEFSGDTNLPTSTYAEFNTQPLNDPATGSADANGFIYSSAGGSSGAGVTGTRETTSTDPGTLEAANMVHTTLTAAQAAQYYPVNFLSSPVPTPSPSFTGFTNTWDPTAALTAGINGFAPVGGAISINSGSSVTILVRPQTPGGGVIPAGTYTILDGSTTIASGTLDATGEAYFTTHSLSVGTHNITTTYSGDSNFNASSSSSPFVITVSGLPSTVTTLGASATSVPVGSPVTMTATVTAGSGTPTGTVAFTVGATSLGSAPVSGGVAAITTSALPAGADSVTATYSGDTNFSGSSGSITVTVSGSLSFSVPTLTFGAQTDGTSSSTSAVTLTNNTGFTISNIAISAPAGFTVSSNTCPTSLASGTTCGFNIAFSPNVGQAGSVSGNVMAVGGGFSASVAVSGTAVPIVGAPPVATGDTRTVTEPSFPATCQALAASFHDVNGDVPTSVESINTELDVTRLQAALNACSGTNQAVELTMDASGNNAFLTGPITLPTGVTLLIDPGVTLYFSRNAQDYDTTPGTHTCGTVSNNSNTSSCKNLITITNDTNSGIMGYGEINARGGDVVLNSFATPGFEGTTAGKSWWDLATDANTLGASQQNPRGIQISKSSNITFYKFTYRNAPNFHVAISSVNGFTVWDMKIITPYSARNTDGIDPGGTVNATITQSWISDGDDNIALGASGAATQNVSVINNHFFAGHGESIGSITTNGVSNALFDNNTMYGDADVDGSNSTAIRIKSANDRGGLVQNIQYSNSCFANHGTQIQFTPVYNTNSGTNTPNFKNILLQNLRFSNQGPTATGLVQFLGASNNGVINPLGVTLDNVTMDSLAASNFTVPTNVNITLGPGQVSSTLTSLLLPVNGTNGNVITDNRTASQLFPPPCNFTFLIPEFTSASGQNNVTVTAGQIPTGVVYLAPAFASTQYPYPTGTVTLTDEGNRTFTATLAGKDTTFIPIPDEPAGTHTFTASYSGDSKYPAITNFGSLTVTVNAGSLTSSSLVLTGVPSSETFGTPFTASATVAGASPTGSIIFLVNGSAYATVPLAAGAASFNFNLAFGSYTISAVYSGDANNAGSTSANFPLNVTGAMTTTTLTASTITSVVGTPVPLSATVISPAGTAAGTVSFSYTTSTNPTPTTLGNATLNASGIASFGALLPQGIDAVTATYAGTGSFNGSNSNSVTITVSAAPPVPVSAAPVPLPYTITTLVGGASSTANTTCTGHLDSFGDGCLGTAVQITGGTSGDLRGVTVDPFGNVYFTDANANLVRKVTPAGIVTQFAGYISGTACVPTATVGCTTTLVKLNKPRGVYSDPLGNIYIGGYGDNKVQVVRVSDGKMYLVAGTGTAESTPATNGDGGPAPAALLKQPRSVGTDAAGNIYIADTGANLIREVLNPNSGLPGADNIQTIAGNGTTASSGDGGLATAASINNPQGVLIDANANVYIAESAKVRVVCVTCAPGTGLYSLLVRLGVTTPTNGIIYTLAGTGTSSNPLLTPGLSNTVNMAPQKLAMDVDGNLYIVDSANNVVWFVDTRTGWTHVIAGGGTTTSCAASTIGDGCAATQATFGSNGGNGIGVALDLQNNMYISDSTNLRIRKISNNLRFPAGSTGTPVARTVEFHFVAGDSPTGTVLTSPDFTLSAPSCTINPNDNTDDCVYTATFTPQVAGLRGSPLSVTTSQGNTGYYALTGSGQGAGATLDPASQLNFGNNVTANAVATDNAGNVYVADGATGTVKKYAAGAASAGTSAPFTSLGTFTNPSAVAVDSMGNVFVADASAGSVTQITPAGTSTKLALGFTAPQGLAVDALNNLYVTDSTAQTVTEIGSNQLGSRVIANANLLGPAGVAVDANLNVFVADPAASAVYRYDSQSLARTTATNAAATPRAVAVDAAGNLLVGDASTSSILAVPASSNSAPFTVASGIPANTLALDNAGDIYTASSGSQVLELVRTQALTAFSGTGASPITVNVLSTGNLPASLTLNDPDQMNFSLVLNPSTDCTGSGTANVVAGGTCQFISSFTPASFGTLTNTATFSGNTANSSLAVPPALEIVQTGSNQLAACVTTLAGKATASTGLQPARAALTWTPVTGVAGYDVLRSNVTGGPYTLLGSTTTPAYADTNGLVNSSTYYYVVDPTNAAGQSLCQSNEAAVAVPKGR